MTDKHLVYLGIGSNLGDKAANVAEAINRIGERIGRVEWQSALLVSKPWGFDSKNDFVNAVVACTTTMSPLALLKATQAIEREMGRTQKSHNGNYHDRIIDIDILLYDDLNIDYPNLKIPHPLMRERDFVMIPLREVLPIGGDGM